MTAQAKKTKLLKLLAKKPIYERILLRKKLYFWYRQMVHLKFLTGDKKKLHKMKQKIFTLTITSTIQRQKRKKKQFMT